MSYNYRAISRLFGEKPNYIIHINLVWISDSGFSNQLNNGFLWNTD